MRSLSVNLASQGRPDEYQYITKTRALDEYRLKPAIESLTPEKFQYLIADRLEQWGLEVQLVGKINRKDGGIDLIAYPRSGLPFLLAVQAKHHRRGGPTGVESIREFHGALTSTHSPFHMGMLVTNTRFTPDATWFAEQNRRLLRLRDLEHLRRWFRRDFSNEAEWNEIPSKVTLALGVEITIPRQTLIVPPPRRLVAEPHTARSLPLGRPLCG